MKTRKNNINKKKISKKVGGKPIDGIDSFFNKIYNISVTNINSSICKFDLGKIVYDITLIKELRGGKSGDKVSLIKCKDKNYILKVFKKGNKDKSLKDDNEIKYHKIFMNLFRNFTPCPILHLSGTFNRIPFSESDEVVNSKYVIMEALSPPYELNNFIETKCDGKEDKLYPDLDIKNVVIQILYIISKMLGKNLFHCDMHTGNIMIVPNEHKISLDFSHVGSDYKFEIGSHLVKIIDFGEGAKSVLLGDSFKSCRLNRTTSSVLQNLDSKCKGISILRSYTKLLKEQVFDAKGSIDINFFVTILKIIAIFDKRFKKIDFIKLQVISEKMETTNPSFTKKQQNELRLVRHKQGVINVLNELTKI